MALSRRTAVTVAIAALMLSACGSGSHDNATSSAVSGGGGGGGSTDGGGGSGGADRMTGMDMSGAAKPGGAMAGMNMAAVDGDGLSKTVDGYSLTNLTFPAKAGKAGTMTFVINGPQDKPQTDFTLQQTKLLHLYVVRKDLTQFQHIHPTLDMKTGLWSVPVTFAEPGPYHVVVEFEALKSDGYFDYRIIGTDFKVGGGSYKPVPFAPVPGTASVDGYQVALDPTAKVHGPDLHLHITKNGADVTDIQPYLESFAHVTGFRSGDLKAVHVHPNEGPAKNDPNAHGGPSLTLASLFTVPGKYRMFIEFQTDGTVHRVPIDVDVS
jgi:hypothetical protein